MVNAFRQGDTRQILENVIRNSDRLSSPDSLFFDDGKLYHAYKATGLEIATDLESTTTQFDFINLNSFSYDRHIYQHRETIVPGGCSMISQLAAMNRVLIITPFNRSKERVPFSPRSLYVPYQPDLDFR